jgi:hypothetical protein
MRQEIHVSSHLHTHTHTSNTLQELIFQKGSGLVGAFVAACARASHICVTDTNDATILGASTPDASIVVFTGCDSPSRRALGTMWISRDGGATWPQKVLVEPEGFAYSLPVQLASGEIGVVHETGGYKRIVLRRVTVPAAAASPAAR